MSAYTGVVADLDESTYHAHPALSSTEARLILSSPAKYRWRKDNPPLIDHSDKFDVGSAVHSKVLGAGYPVEVLDFPDYRTKAAREAREDARTAGLVPILREKYIEVEQMSESVLAHPTARALFDQPGSAEASVFATVDGVDVRARFDFLPEQGERRRIAVDLKTTIDASVKAFERAVATYGYDVQRAWYLDALNAVTGPMPHGLEPEMVFLAVEKEPPYLVAVHQLSMQWAEMGHTKAARAAELFAACTQSGVWPGYPNEVQLLTPPTWAVYEHEEKYGVS